MNLAPESVLDSLRAVVTGTPGLDGVDATLVSRRHLTIQLRGHGFEVPVDGEQLRVFLRLRKGSRVGVGVGSSPLVADLKDLVTRTLALAEASPEQKIPSALVHFEGASPQLGTYDGTFQEIPLEEKIHKVLNLESNLRKADKLRSVLEVGYSEELAKTAVWSQGSSKILTRSSSLGRVFGAVQAAEGDTLSPTLSEFRAETHYYDLDWTGLGKSLAANAGRLIGARKVNSGQYSLLFSNHVMAKLLRRLSPAFAGWTSLQGLASRVPTGGERVGPEFLNITDDPHMGKRPGSKSFDDEGIPTERLSIVKDGIFVNEIHSLETGWLAGTSSSGHGLMDFNTGRMEARFHNLFVEPGTRDYVDLLREMGNGLLVTRARLASGSHQHGRGFAEIGGVRIENGVEKEPFARVFIEWDVRQILSKLKMVGRDLVWHESFGAPCALFSDVRVMEMV